MKPLIPCLALLVLSAAACTTTGGVRFDDGAQTATYYPLSGQPGAAGLQAALGVCDQREGAGGADPGRDYKACMRSLGWRYAYAGRDGQYPDPDPDEAGLSCHDFVVLGVVGSSCSNF